MCDYGSCLEKTCLQGLYGSIQPGQLQRLEYCILFFPESENKGTDQTAQILRLVCTMWSTCSRTRFSHIVAHMVNMS